MDGSHGLCAVCSVGLGQCSVSGSVVEDMDDRAHRISFWQPSSSPCANDRSREAPQRDLSSAGANRTVGAAECQLLPESLEWSWNSTVGACGPSRLSRKQACLLLQCKHLMFVGDSIIRNLALAVANLTTDPDAEALAVERHADMVFQTGCNTTITFLWRPFLANVTQTFATWPSLGHQAPNHIVTGVSLWDVLHITDTHQHAADAADFVEVLEPLLQAPDGEEWEMWWVTTTTVRQARLPTDEKRATMTESNLKRYRSEQLAHLQQPLAAAPAFHVLDLHTITARAPASATSDGIHFDTVVYEASAQALLNMVQARTPAGRTATCRCSSELLRM